MSSTSRVFAILDLFTTDKPIWATDDINRTLGYSRPTGYRYVKELVEAGFLQKVSAGRYALGGRIMMIDYIQRQTDPFFVNAAPLMQNLIAESGLSAILSMMFNDQIVDTHHVNENTNLRLIYSRGRVRPLFRGAAAKILLSQLPRLQLARIYESHREDARERGLGDNWPDFKTSMNRIRHQGFYLSHGELEPEVSGAAVPIFNPDNGQVAALTLVGTLPAMQAAGEARLKYWLQTAAQRIQERFEAWLP